MDEFRAIFWSLLDFKSVSKIGVPVRAIDVFLELRVLGHVEIAYLLSTIQDFNYLDYLKFIPEYDVWF